MLLWMLLVWVLNTALVSGSINTYCVLGEACSAIRDIHISLMLAGLFSLLVADHYLMISLVGV